MTDYKVTYLLFTTLQKFYRFKKVGKIVVQICCSGTLSQLFATLTNALASINPVDKMLENLKDFL